VHCDPGDRADEQQQALEPSATWLAVKLRDGKPRADRAAGILSFALSLFDIQIRK
jgi:hypothetical protein